MNCRFAMLSDATTLAQMNQQLMSRLDTGARDPAARRCDGFKGERGPAVRVFGLTY
jgi:hypothetical protein